MMIRVILNDCQNKCFKTFGSIDTTHPQFVTMIVEYLGFFLFLTTAELCADLLEAFKIAHKEQINLVWLLS